jgi:hypothetical protein
LSNRFEQLLGIVFTGCLSDQIKLCAKYGTLVGCLIEFLQKDVVSGE